MANFLSEPSEIATSGERTFFNRIQSIFTEENHIIGYFEPDLGGLHPDFLLLSPKYGIIIVELKDYSEKYLKTGNISKTGKWERLKGDNIKRLDNPFDQLHQYWRVVKDRIDKCHFPEEFRIPINRLVVFSEISSNSHLAKEIKKIAPVKISLCFRETLKSEENFKMFINDLLPVNLQLSEDQFKLLRANLIPTCRLPTIKQADLLKYFSPEDKIKLLDQAQERLARELGEGHRLMFGVAGSGKTVLLIARARILAKRHPNWKILILCYNRLLKNLLLNLLNPQDYEADITINTFHGWARRYIFNYDNEIRSKYQEEKIKAEKEDKLTLFFEFIVPKLLKNLFEILADEKIYYDAILIDEAQDFEAEWFRCVMEILNPETNSLLITCDGLQGIYDRKKFRWSHVGIQARGRVKRFQKSYRVPIEIGTIAQKALPQKLKDLLDQFDEFMSTKEFIGIQGTVEIIGCKSREEEYIKLSEKISRYLKNPNEVLVLFKYNMAKKEYSLPFFDHLKKYKIKWKDLKDYNYQTPGLLIGTLHGTKGLEADTIIIPELDMYKSDNDRQLIYVGMTRARKRLILSYCGPTGMIEYLEPN